MQLMSVVGFTETGLIEAIFDEAADEAAEPDLQTRLCLDEPDHLYRQLVAEWEAAGNTIPLFVPVPKPYWLYKSVFISRLTSLEAEVMEGVLAAADAKLRLMFNSVEYFVSDDPLFATLTATVGAALGPNRADELLAAR